MLRATQARAIALYGRQAKRRSPRSRMLVVTEARAGVRPGGPRSRVIWVAKRRN